MTQKKRVAKTLTEILNNPIMEIILDRSRDIETIIEEVNNWWGFDLYSRKPGVAYRDENGSTTDLDLSCFLYELARRNAVINIPEYKSMRATKLKEGQALVSKNNRHGQILGLTANKDVFSFSLRIKDMNVINSSGVGDYRNFSITDLDGDFYEGWGNLEFKIKPTPLTFFGVMFLPCLTCTSFVILRLRIRSDFKSMFSSLLVVPIEHRLLSATSFVKKGTP